MKLQVRVPVAFRLQDEVLNLVKTILLRFVSYPLVTPLCKFLFLEFSLALTRFAQTARIVPQVFPFREDGLGDLCDSAFQLLIIVYIRLLSRAV